MTLPIATVPLIGIRRHALGIYEWRLSFGAVKVDGDIGETNIRSCLIAAFLALPDDAQVVEIQYNGQDMGNHPVPIADILQRVGEIVSKINAEVRELRSSTG